MIMNKFILFVVSNIKTFFSKGFMGTFETVKNILAVIGIVASIYLIFFFSITKNSILKESEEKIKTLTEEVKDNNITIEKLRKENEGSYEEIEKLQNELDDIQIKNKKYKKDYEKNIDRINAMSNNKLSRVFADEFKN